MIWLVLRLWCPTSFLWNWSDSLTSTENCVLAHFFTTFLKNTSVTTPHLNLTQQTGTVRTASVQSGPDSFVFYQSVNRNKLNFISSVPFCQVQQHCRLADEFGFSSAEHWKFKSVSAFQFLGTGLLCWFFCISLRTAHTDTETVLINLVMIHTKKHKPGIVLKWGN